MINTDFKSWFLNLTNKTLSSNRPYLYRLTEQSDKIIVWLVGFSIASIALTISNESELNLILRDITKFVLIFGSLTVIFGVLYRIFLYLAQTLEINILITFEAYVEGLNNPPNIDFGRKLTDEDTYDDIVNFIKKDFEIEIERIDILTFDANQIDIFRKSVIEKYLSLNNQAYKKKHERETNEVKIILSKYLGYSKKKISKIFNPKEHKVKLTSLYWVFLHAASLLFVLSCLAFIIGMITILIVYLKNNYN